jgi:hypothetical protein
MEEYRNSINDKLNDEATLRGLIFKLQEFFQETISNWKLVIIITALFIAFFLYKAFSTPTIYTAELSFMINEEGGGGMGGAGALLNQFGFGGGNSKYSLDKIVDLSKTSKISNFVFFEKITIEGKEDYIGNHILDLSGMRDNWEEGKPMKGFRFNSENITKFSRLENLALRILHNVVIGKRGGAGKYATDINTKTGIMYISMNSRSEELAIKWLELVFKHLSSFYIEKTVEKQKFTFDILKEKADSIKNELISAEFNLANFTDTNKSLWKKTAGLKQQRLSRDVKILTLIYGEAIKNLEIADFTLKSKMPFIQLIDAPVAPVKTNEISIPKFFLTGCILGVLVSLGFIFCRKIYRDAMQEEVE